MKVSMGGHTRAGKAIHAIAGEWSYNSDNKSKCGIALSGNDHLMSGDVEVTCERCIKIASEVRISITERVANGATLLDERVPDWFRYIGPEIDIRSLEGCVLGQVYGAWVRGTEELGIEDDRYRQEYYGFELTGAEYRSKRVDAVAKKIEREWRKHVNARLDHSARVAQIGAGLKFADNLWSDGEVGEIVEQASDGRWKVRWSDPDTAYSLETEKNITRMILGML